MGTARRPPSSLGGQKPLTITERERESPRTLEVDEHRYIQKLRTIRPLGLNAMDPFGIPLLDLT